MSSALGWSRSQGSESLIYHESEWRCQELRVGPGGFRSVCARAVLQMGGPGPESSH